VKFGPREIIFVVLLLAIPLASWWLSFRPMNQRNEEVLAEIEQRRAKLQQLNRTTGAMGDLEKEIQALEEAMDLFQSKLPNEKEIDKVLQEIWKLAESNELTTKSIRTTSNRRRKSLFPAGGHSEQPITIELEGDFKGFYAFLLALESQPRIMRISKMVVQKDKKAAEGHIAATFELSIFFEKSKEKT